MIIMSYLMLMFFLVLFRIVYVIEMSFSTIYLIVFFFGTKYLMDKCDGIIHKSMCLALCYAVSSLVFKCRERYRTALYQRIRQEIAKRVPDSDLHDQDFGN